MRRHFEILLVEDNPGDVRLLQESMSAIARHTVSVARDGAEALAFLRREGDYISAPRPDIVLLDLGLPALPGFDVLSAIKGDPMLRRIPVIVLTSSAARDDVQAAYAHHANAFITKPADLDQFVTAVQAVADFYLSIARLPDRPSGGFTTAA